MRGDRFNVWRRPRGFVGHWDAFHWREPRTLAQELRAFRQPPADRYSLPGGYGPADPRQRGLPGTD